MRNDNYLKIAKRVYKAHFRNVLAFVFLQNMVISSLPTPSLAHEREFVSTSSSTLTETEIGFFAFLWRDIRPYFTSSLYGVYL